MAFFFFFLLCLDCFALDVVELEPVGADTATNEFKCNTYNGLTANCSASPYCIYISNKCVDDPCLKYMTSETDQCIDLIITVGSTTTTIGCGVETVNTDLVTGTDCSGDPGSGLLCRATGSGRQKWHDYCQYRFLKDTKTCPVSLCREYNPSTGANLASQCIKNNKVSCSILSTEEECGLVPKCYWAGGLISNQGCVADKCFAKGQDCSTWTGASGSGLAAGDCVDYKPLNPSGEVEIYCVHKNNKNPNICYLAGNNFSAVSDDYITITGPNFGDGTYPSFFFWTVNAGTSLRFYKPDCSTPLPGCDGTGNCKTIYNVKGALAGAYCTDGAHGDDGTSILRIPSLLVFLFVLASMFF